MSSSAIRRSTPRWNRDARNPPPESARPSFSGRTPLPADVATKTSSLRCARGEALSVRARVRAHRELICEVAVYPQQPRLDLDVPEHWDLRSRALDLELVEPSYRSEERRVGKECRSRWS